VPTVKVFAVIRRNCLDAHAVDLGVLKALGAAVVAPVFGIADGIRHYVTSFLKSNRGRIFCVYYPIFTPYRSRIGTPPIEADLPVNNDFFNTGVLLAKPSGDIRFLRKAL